MPLKVMVVDDDPVALKSMMKGLERLEMEVSVWSDSREAAARLAEERFDMFLVDARMPGLDGFELTRRIRASRLNSNVPIVMLTASDDGSTMREGFKSGITFFLGKPVNFARLRGLLQAARGSAMKERRRHVRIPFRTEMLCRFGERRFAAKSLDLGGNGMSFAPSGGLEEGQVLEMSFILPGDQSPVHLHAKVMRLEPPDSAAVEFVDLVVETRAALKNFFAGLMKAAA
ncbi:MAG TPA: response regulator [Terriglobia bacterium]|nr:response regulator [Terriglobia bacterium]